MRYFPIFFDLRNRPVTVIGGGEEAVRKIRLLLKTEAKIAVIAPHFMMNLPPSRASTGSHVITTRPSLKALHWSIRQMPR
jgi:siroheme synthase-like protein